MSNMSNSNLHEKFKNLMEEEIRGVQLGIYSIAGLGLAIAVYKVRPFSTFTHPKHIPRSFIKDRVRQNGRVLRIEPDKNALLMVDHYPPLRIPFLNSNNPGLPVKVLGINLSGNGISWLQTIVAGRKVEFIPITLDDKFVNCIVTMHDRPLSNPKAKTEILNIGECLVRIGFATVNSQESSLAKDPIYKNYKSNLDSAQLEAQCKSVGIWSDGNHRPSIMKRLQWHILQKVRELIQWRPKFNRKKRAVK